MAADVQEEFSSNVQKCVISYIIFMSFAHRFAHFHTSDIQELKWSGLVSKLGVKRGRLVIMPLAILHLRFFGHIAHLIEKC